MGFYPGAHLIFGVLMTPHVMDEETSKVIKDIATSSPVELQQHGHYDNPDGPPTFLVLKGYEFRGDAWSPEKISPISMQVHHNIIEQADEFCETNGLPSFDDPKWYLVASYG